MSERAKLLNDLEVFLKHIDAALIRDARAQIEADGKEIERLRALVTAQEDRDAYRAKQDAIEAREPRPLHTGRQ